MWGKDQDEKLPPEKKKPATHNRLYTFAVQKTKDQEESVFMHGGFEVWIADHPHAVPLFLM
jgi:hypothetical protein